MRLAIVLVGASASAADEVAAPEGSELGPYAIVVIGDEDDAFGPMLGNPGVLESVGPLGGRVVFGARRRLDTDAWWPMASSFPDRLESTGTLDAPCQGVLGPGDIDVDGAVGPRDLAVLLGRRDPCDL